MPDWLEIIGAFALFLLGLRLSAFFSGAETGFYRVSFLRLSIEAHSGDRIAARILWFARHPSYFVATTLIGNNVANYLTTSAISLAVVAVMQSQAAWVEICGTLLISPVVFVFGELMPKNLYYRAPLMLLRRDSTLFEFFFRLFLIVSFPLIWITSLFERLAGSDKQTLEMVLGRKRLVQVLHQGYQQGLLTDVQGRLVQGLMHTAAERIVDSVTPANRVFGVDDDTTRDGVVECARRYGINNVAVKRKDSADDWYGYVRLVDVVASRKPVSALIRTMPQLLPSANKLDALLILQESGEGYAVVRDNETVVGTISKRGLVEQLIRPRQTLGSAKVAPE